MKRVLITGAGSYVGESVKKYILASQEKVGRNSGEVREPEWEIDSVDTMSDAWKQTDFSKYDVVYHVAGIAHVNADPKMEPLYYKVNRDLTIEIAKHAKENGVKQFIFMSSQIVFHESKSLKTEVLTKETKPNPNGFYGDSKLQAEIGLWNLVSKDPSTFNPSTLNPQPSTVNPQPSTMKICILRPCMIYGPNAKGNFPRLAKLATKVPVFPVWHNKRSMLYIDNLAEFVKQAIERQLEGTFYPQNREQADTVEIIRYFAKAAGHKVWITKLFNPFVWLGSFVLQPINKMFATYYYDPEMSKMDFDYQLVSFEESLKRVAESLKTHA